MPALRKLHLQESGLGDAGASAIARALQQGTWGSLEELNLSACGLGDEGAVSFAIALRHGVPKLRELNLSGNRLGHAAAKAPELMQTAQDLQREMIKQGMVQGAVDDAMADLDDADVEEDADREALAVLEELAVENAAQIMGLPQAKIPQAPQAETDGGQAAAVEKAAAQANEEEERRLLARAEML